MTPTPSGERDRLQVNDDLAFQRKTWRFERIGWVVMGLIAVAALLGLAGPGVLSDATVKDDRLRVEYERFQRRDAPTKLKAHIGADAVRGEAFTLRFDANFTSDFDIERVVPEPVEWRLTPGGLELRFAAAGAGPLGTVQFDLKPQAIGPGTAHIGIAARAPLQLRYFVYP